MKLKFLTIVGIIFISLIAIKFLSYPYIFLYFEFAFLLVYLSLKQKTLLKNIVIYIAILIFTSFGVLEIYYVRQNLKIKTNNKLTLTNGFRFKDEPGYLTFQKNLTSHATFTICDTIIYDAIYTSDNDGLRISPNLNNNAPINVIFLGGSFTFGDGLMDAETLPYQFEILGKGNYSTFNYGRSGSGARGMLRDVIISGFLKSTLNGKIPNIAIFTSLGVHVLRDYNYNPYWYRIIRKSFLFQNKFSPSRWDVNVKNYVDYLSTIEKILREKYNTKLIVLLWEGKIETTKKNWFNNSDKLINAFEQTKLNVVIVEEEIFSNYKEPNTFYHIKGFDHPTAIANTRIAEYLHNYLRN